jgi:hypothetical protein
MSVNPHEQWHQAGESLSNATLSDRIVTADFDLIDDQSLPWLQRITQKVMRESAVLAAEVKASDLKSDTVYQICLTHTQARDGHRFGAKTELLREDGGWVLR